MGPVLVAGVHHSAATLLLTLVVTAPAAAQATPRTHIDRAQALYAEMRYAEVVPELDQALAQSGNSESQLVEIYALLGTVQVVLNNSEAARAAFVSLVKLDPQHQLDPRLSPKIRDFFSDARRSARPVEPVRFSGPAVVSGGDGAPFVVEVELETPVPAGLTVELWSRSDRRQPFASQPMVRQGQQHFRAEHAVPATADLIEYYVATRDALGRVAGAMGSEAVPLTITVRSAEWYLQPTVWIAVGVTGAIVVAAAAVTAVVLASSSDGEKMSLGTHTLD